MQRISVRDIRLENMQAVFQEIALSGHTSKREIAEATGLSLVTVGKIVSALCRAGILTKAQASSHVPGRPAERFTFQHNAAIPIFDLSCRTFRFSLYTATGERIDEVCYRFSSDPQFCNAAFIRFLQRTLQFLKANYPRLRILGVGVIVPGVYEKVTDRIFSTMIPELSEIKPLQNIEKIFKTGNIIVDNAARLSAESLFRTVEGKEDKTLCCLTVNDSVECAVAERGHFLTGASKLAGRLGDLPHGSLGTLSDYIAGAVDAVDIEEPLLALLQIAALAYDPEVLFLLSSRFRFPQEMKERLAARLAASFVWRGAPPRLAIYNTDLAERQQSLCLRILDAWFLLHIEPRA